MRVNIMTLMYDSSNERHVNFNELNLLPIPASQGPRHLPYGFGDYMTDIKEAFDKSGVEISAEEYVVSNDNNRFFGTMAIKPLQGEFISATDWELLMGVRGAHDQRISRGLALGSNVFVCSNLIFSGSLGTFKTKQTTYLSSRLPALIHDAVQRIPELAHKQEVKYDRFKEFEMKPRWGDAALVEVHRRGGLSSVQLGVAIKEWDEPSYDHGDHTAWRLMNACTESLKPRGANANHHIIADRGQIIDGFISEVAGIQ